MIDLDKALREFNGFLKGYNNIEDLGFKLKVVHTYHVLDNAKTIAEMLELTDEDVKLAQLIALLHDIGRFEEITFMKTFDSVKFDHAAWGVKMLFEDGLIGKFIDDERYDEIIRAAIDNHSRLKIEDGLESKALLHAKIIRDADKLDNFRVKKTEVIEAIFPGKVKGQEELEASMISDSVYEAVVAERCVDIMDRKTPLDYWICVLAFIIDLNFKETLGIVRENDYINVLIDRFNYIEQETKEKMEKIRVILNEYVEKRLNGGE